MGLTVHYALKSATRSEAKARSLVDELHDFTMQLPFQEVGEIVDLEGDAADFNKAGRDNPNSWMLLQAAAWMEIAGMRFKVAPKRLIGFETLPGDGCESANFGLVLLPKTIEYKGKKLRTGAAGWTWSSFCKTVYAGNPARGGVENFLKCHLTLIAMLDVAKCIRILDHVNDESGYWEHRDVKKLAAAVGEWNTMLPGYAGRFKDAFGPEVQIANFAKFPDFEHLEADAAVTTAE